MNFKKDILELIGNTPLVRMNKINKGLKPQIFAKLESANPGGSVKDRIGISMLIEAEKSGRIKPGGIVVEATSGNTGIGLALACIIKGYKAIFVLTDKVSTEKINYLRALNADVIVVSNAAHKESKDYYVNVARQIADENPNALFMYQYSNPANPEVHYKTTGPEIWRDTEGKITHLVSGIGTGGTISGTGRYLKEKNPDIKIIGADPYGSIFSYYKETGKLTEGNPYLVEGIGQDYIPDNVDFNFIDRVIDVSDSDSFNYARLLTREEGIFCGGSTGTAVYAALKVAEEIDEKGLIVFVVADTGERYLSKFHSDEWLKENNLLQTEVRTLKDLSNVKKNGELVSLSSKDKIKRALEVFTEKGCMQIPVIDNGESIGSIKEGKLLSTLINNQALLEAPVETIMGPGFPTLDERTELSVVKKYLSDSPAILVTEYGRIIDIVTRYDVIKYTENQ
jgi:cystathionine beta-synthase